ncbi:MAG: hypothetical protein US95_C0058G0002 [Candidatus Woesebacteria bacterium GW2011_GWB1_38_5]|uniref:Minus agglutinin n=4 Tax=Candidatus Woeseibacteriota TaxID=1752722 RepID=A0A0G0K325_9BACT|nr:MAG: hypothetical protein US67_C0054G0004 [Candidatus Woesebacteria bacterium GW2011_GWD1_38_10]KKQ56599.1 MAG: hypothetical protein US75_C0005G0024 [Candidatus Woesebacteria bacterium GW2011_GWC1_38_13]KKQ73177.1 MAG: hypothetical protein US95_C0058G0002 [Candidatus Woesebacteria bacterium GW2011_GWB1_38_5]KKQ84634.1 MAG: hypothetical protein UT06_C0002G0002 [Candidatus Woesebacteria bacterium GW2011_GWA1_38_8]
MEQHPIPQQIASYQFKLVGDMTLKQFTQLAGGILISLLLYASPLHPFVKWPLIVISFLFGVALAFLPIEDRPLSTWIFIFFRAIYSPTYFVWNKSIKHPEYFSSEETSSVPASIKIAEKKEDVQELLAPVVKQTASTDKLEEKEKTFLTKLTQNFIAPNTTVVISTTPVHTFSDQVLPQVVQAPQTLTQPPLVQPAQAQTKPAGAGLNIPETRIVDLKRNEGFQSPSTIQIGQPSDMSTSSVVPQTYQKTDVQKMANLQFNAGSMPPMPATRENVVVGQVFDQFGKILEGVILEIKDVDGRPVRALKSNKLGHFAIATPLIEGVYIISAEKDGYEFEPFKLSVENKIIPPISVWAKSGGSQLVEKATKEPTEDENFIKDFKL